MSAFIVSKKHIDALVTFAIATEYGQHIRVQGEEGYDVELGNHLTPDEIGQILWDENFRSVNHRYDSSDKAERYTFRSLIHKPAQIIKACHCYDYQACETDDYEFTLAHRIIEAIIESAAHKVEGYEAAAWAL